jgi:hypothetical protein
MAKKIIILTCVVFSLVINVASQTDYSSGNAAYNAEKNLGYNPVTINGGSYIYYFDNIHRLYRSNDLVLIPDLMEVPDGNYISEDSLFGFDIGGICSNNHFQWDNQIQFSSSVFDQNNLFVSPLSQINMTYGKAIQFTNDTCYYGDCTSIIDGPDSSLVYSLHSPFSGVYDLWTGQELIDAGDMKGTGISQKISQQQSDTTINCGYCAKTYGPGWRLPTDIEAGHTNDNEGLGNGFDQAYSSPDSTCYIWTSSLFITYAVKRWTVRMTDGTWENCAGFISIPNKVRCVYHAGDYSVSKEIIENKDCSKIFPNPANEIINLSFLIGEKRNFFIYDFKNSLIKEIESDEATIIIDVSEFSKGLYFLKIISEKNTESKIISVM